MSAESEAPGGDATLRNSGHPLSREGRPQPRPSTRSSPYQVTSRIEATDPRCGERPMSAESDAHGSDAALEQRTSSLPREGRVRDHPHEVRRITSRPIEAVDSRRRGRLMSAESDACCGHAPRTSDILSLEREGRVPDHPHEVRRMSYGQNGAVDSAVAVALSPRSDAHGGDAALETADTLAPEGVARPSTRSSPYQATGRTEPSTPAVAVAQGPPRQTRTVATPPSKQRTSSPRKGRARPRPSTRCSPVSSHG